MSRPLWVEQARAWPIASVAAVLPGLVAVRGWTWPCGACGARTRHTKTRDRRGAIGLDRDGRGWRCFQCDRRGDIVDFIAVHAVGKVLRECDEQDSAGVREVCVRMGLCDGRVSLMERPLRERVMPPPAPPVWPGPDPEEVMEVIAASGPCGEEVQAFCVSRGWGRVGEVLAMAGARVLRPPEWAGWETLAEDHEGKPWWPAHLSRTWNLAQPMVDVSGVVVGFQARVMGDPPIAKPKDGKPAKALPKALGHRMQRRGWFATPSALSAMRAGVELERVMVVEGITDFWASCVMLAAAPREQRIPVIGGVSGSFEEPPKVAKGGVVYVATDADKAGDAYAAKVAAALPGRKIMRIRMEVDDG